MRYWLMKSEPSVFSFEDLTKQPGRTTHWEGVRNYQARNFLRDEIKKGDQVLVYHSNTDEPAVMGVAVVVKEGYPDDAAMDAKSKYYDPDAKKKRVNPWFMVDIQAVSVMKAPITRALLAQNAGTKTMMVLKRGARLSIQPVTAFEFRAVCKLGSPKPL